MRVVFDHQIFEDQRYGGISRYFVEVARELNRLPDWDACVAAPLSMNEYLAATKVPGWHHHAAWRFRGAARVRAAVNRGLAGLLPTLLDADVVHATYFRPAARRRGRPLVLTVYDMIHEVYPGTDTVTAPLKRAAVQAADHVVCISEHTRRDLIERLKVPESKTSVTHLAHSIHPPENRMTETGRPYLLYVGFRHAYKNFDGFLQAYARSPQLQSAFELRCFGGGAFTAEEVARMAALGVDARRVHHEAGDDAALARAYAGATAFVYPSLYEGFGIPPLEAMACSCPVICSARSSIPEVVGAAAVYFDPEDPDAIRAALESVCFDTERRQALVDAGHQRQALFSWRQCAIDTAAVYAHLTA